MDKSKEYRLRLYHTHTNERIDIVYRHGDAYVPGAIDRLNRFLRDHRTGEVHRYNPRVFDLLNDLSMAVGRPGSEIDVICGYRTSRSNEFLRRNSRGVALHSLHMQAEAIDIRIPGIATSRLRDVALALSRGGRILREIDFCSCRCGTGPPLVAATTAEMSFCHSAFCCEKADSAGANIAGSDWPQPSGRHRVQPTWHAS